MKALLDGMPALKLDLNDKIFYQVWTYYKLKNN